ncbi:MAG: COR domain-containing protein [bacterium]
MASATTAPARSPLLTGVTDLDLRGNDIGAAGAQVILDGWLDRPGVRYLRLNDNPAIAIGLPPELLDSGDAPAILAAWRRYRGAEGAAGALPPLNEARLLVVGNEAVGKTSLIRYLTTGAPRDRSELKTPGAVIHERIETRSWAPDGCAVTLNVWDFGGQEIMHGTHRFFLSERCLYLLVLEARREDDDTVYDWLKTIRNRGGDSPVLVVINKCDDDSSLLRLDETRIRREFGVVDFVRTSCDPGERAAGMIAALRAQIVRVLAEDERLRHVRDPMPRAWLRIKEALADEARVASVLPLRSFERLCAAGEGDDAVPDPHEQRALLRLLHELGVVIAHGLRRDATAAQREVTLLDPNWLTGAIYPLLNSRQVVDQGGEFSVDDLRALLDPRRYPEDWYEYIIGLMAHPDVGLCFELPSKRGRYLMPEALPANEPEYGMAPADALRFRVDYGFLPPGLLPRFIVEAHGNLTERGTRWRMGVVLQAAGCHVLVRGDRDRRRVELSVWGPAGQRRSALNVVLDRLEAVHRLNPEAGPVLRVPLPDVAEASVGYEHLLKLEERYGPEHVFDPEGATRAYTVRELLDGVRLDRRLEARGDPRRRAAANDAAAVGWERDVSRDHIAMADANGAAAPAMPSGDAAAPVIAVVEAAPANPSSDATVSWPRLAIGAGLAAAVGVIGVPLLPASVEWKLKIGGGLLVGLVVAVAVLRHNPAYFYRRWLTYAIPAGLVVHAFGFKVDMTVGADKVQWEGSHSIGFTVAWVMVVLGLLGADLVDRGKLGKNRG